MVLLGAGESVGTPSGRIDDALAHERDLQGASSALSKQLLPLLHGGADEEELLGGIAVVAHHAPGHLAAADRRLRLGLLGDRNDSSGGVLARHNLVDQRGRRDSGPRHEPGPHAVGIDGGRAQRCDRILVKVGGDRDLRGGCSHRVQLPAHLEGLSNEIAGIQAHGPQLATRGARRFNGVDNSLGDVVGVDEQSRARSQGRHLRIEGVALAVVQQGEGVGGGSDRADPVALGGLQIGGALEATDDGGACRGHGGSLVSPACAHVHAGASVSCDRHARRCRSNRAVVVENGQQEGFEQGAVGKAPLDGEQGRPGEVALSLGVAPHVAREAPRGQEGGGLLGDDPSAGKPLDLFAVELEAFQCFEDASRSRHDAEASRRGQAAPEEFEGAAPMRGPVLQGGVEHRELIHVGEERCGCRCRHSVSLP